MAVSSIDDLAQNCQRASPAVVPEEGGGALRSKIVQWAKKNSLPFAKATKEPKWELFAPQSNRKHEFDDDESG